ncbi:MAG: hypothetical protein JSU86_03370 [Phycisphaerales bacterium]|nr:MAG: hypothetical protein JSU86_03370 [Phycisphaerales bacterium]
MNDKLAQTNRDLLHQVSVLRTAISSANVATLMKPYVESVLAMCEALHLEALRQLKDLAYRLEGTIPDILEATQRAGNLLDLVNTRFAPPIIRFAQDDCLPLAFINWLHEEHAVTRGKPFAVSDGGFAVYPTPDWPIVYFLPVTRRMTLLLLPFLIHEFGHLLYACHKPELDELVGEFQQRVARVLAPTTVRDRGPATNDEGSQRAVAEAWYPWTQEVFCDAVGLAVGGESYLKAFSHYFRFRSSQEYYLPRRDQLLRRHPVTRIRTTMLVDRARQLGLSGAASEVAEVWLLTARTLGILEDYEGTWVDELFIPLREIIDNMLEESSPVSYSALPESAPLPTINEAWSRFEKNEPDFAAWEKSAIDTYLDNAIG